MRTSRASASPAEFAWTSFIAILPAKRLASVGTKSYLAGGTFLLPWKPLRQRALRQAREWMFEHLERSEGLAAIYPAMMNAIFALVALGHSPDDPLTAREIDQFSRFLNEEGENNPRAP